MVKSPLLYIIISLFTWNNSFSQIEEVIYKFGYIPNTEYQMDMIQVSKNKIEYFGTEDFLERLAQQGMDNPMYSVDSVYTKTQLKTGELYKDSFSVQMETLEEYRSDGRQVMPVNTKMFGSAKKDAFPVLDSIASIDMSDTKKETFLNIINATLSQLNVTPRKISIGSSFIERDTLQIPVNDANLDILSVSKYTVNDISNGKVFMSIEIDISLLINSELSFKAAATGNGSGEIIYNVSKAFFEEYEMENSLEITVEIRNILMKVNTETKYIQKNSFSN